MRLLQLLRRCASRGAVIAVVEVVAAHGEAANAVIAAVALRIGEEGSDWTRCRHVRRE